MDNNAVNLNRDTLGSVQIANDVVAIIAGLAATEVDGITSMAGNISNELMSKVGYRSLTKGVKVDLSVRMDLGHNIPSACAKVKDKVKTTIENMTGLEGVNVNVRVGGVE